MSLIDGIRGPPRIIGIGRPWRIYDLGTVCTQKVLQFQSLGTLAAGLSGWPCFAKTLPIDDRPLQLTVGVVGVRGSSILEPSLFDRLDRAICQEWYSL